MAAKTKNANYYIKSTIGVAIMVLFGFLPPVGAITPLGMKVLGIYIGLLFLWSLVDMIWPSFVGLFLLGLSGYAGITDLILGGWGNSTNVYIFLICILAYFIIQSGVSDFLVNSIVSRKFAQGKPWMISFLFLFAAYFVGAVVSLTPACLIVWAVFTKYVTDLGYKKGDAYPVIMIVGIALSALMGFSFFPFHPPASILIGMAQGTGYAVPFVGFLFTSFLIGFLTVVVYLILGKYVLRPDVTPLKQEYEFKKSEKLTPYQKQITFFSLLWIGLLIVQSAFEKTMVGEFLNQFGTVGLTLAVLTIMVFLRKKDGKPFVDFIDGTRFGVIWPVFYLLTIGMIMGTVLSDDQLGIAQSIGLILDPLFSREGGLIVFAILVTFFTVLTTNLMYNHVAAMLVYSIAIVYGVRLGINPALLVCVIAVCSNASIIFPSANPVAAIMHGMKDWVTTKDIYKYSIPLAAAVWIIATIVLTFGSILF